MGQKKPSAEGLRPVPGPRIGSAPARPPASAKSEASSYFRKFLVGVMMVVAAVFLTMTLVGAVVGVPLFLVGFVVMGFFYSKMRQAGKRETD